VERQRSLPRSNHLVFINVSQRKLSVEMESRKRGVGYGAGRQGALKSAQDADCVAAWREVQALARRARQLNIANGEALGLRMASNQRVVGFLNSVIGNKLYGPDGRRLRGVD